MITMHKMVGASADDLLPPRDLAKAAFAVMVWASSKMSAEEPFMGYGFSGGRIGRTVLRNFPPVTRP
jgi:hypothetical protein